MSILNATKAVSGMMRERALASNINHLPLMKIVLLTGRRTNVALLTAVLSPSHKSAVTRCPRYTDDKHRGDNCSTAHCSRSNVLTYQESFFAG